MSIIGDLTKFGVFPARRAAPRWRIVATRGAFPFNNEGGPADNYTRFESMLYVRTGRQRVSNVRVVFVNARSGALGEYSDVQAATQIESAMYGGAGSAGVLPFTFNGALNPTLSTGSGLVLSDQLNIDAPANSQIQLRSAGIVASGEEIAGSRLSSGLLYAAFDSTAVVSQVYSSASLAAPPGGANSTYGFAPLCLLGQTDAPENSFLLWGDSIMQGTGETGDASFGHIGWAERGLSNVNGYQVPFCNVSRSGDQTAGYLPRSPRRCALFQYATDAVFGMCSNDISGGIALATIQANCLAIWAAARRAGCRVHQTTITPKTTSTSGNWTSAADQTVASEFDAAGKRGLFNAWVFAQAAAGVIDGVVDVNAAVVDPASPDKWISTGASDYATTDGLHPSGAGHILMAAVFNTYAAALPVRIAYA